MRGINKIGFSFIRRRNVKYIREDANSYAREKNSAAHNFAFSPWVKKKNFREINSSVEDMLRNISVCCFRNILFLKYEKSTAYMVLR